MALTGKFSKGTVTITKGEAANTFTFAGGTTDSAIAGNVFGTDTTVIDASKLSAKQAINIVAAGSSVTDITLGKGNDVVTSAPSGTKITTGAGNDSINVVAGQNIIITDFDGAKDALVLNDALAPTVKGYDFVGKDLSLTFAKADNEGETATIIIVNGKDQLINIYQGENLVNQQSFQAAKTAEYDATDKNTGSVLTSDADFIDASARGAKKALLINATATEKMQEVVGGKGNDTIITSASAVVDGGAGNDDITVTGKGIVVGGAGNDTVSVTDGGVIDAGAGNDVMNLTGTVTVAGGAGNDIYYVQEGTELTITDFNMGKNKDIISLASGLSTLNVNNSGYYYQTQSDGDVVFYFGEAGETSTANAKAKIVVKGGVWDPVGKVKEANSVITFAGVDNAEALTRAYNDPSKLYVTKLKKGETTFDFETATQVGDTFDVDSSTVESITFTPGTAVSIQGGGGYANITTGAGKDTLFGGSKVKKADEIAGADIGKSSTDLKFSAVSDAIGSTTDGQYAYFITQLDSVYDDIYVKVMIDRHSNPDEAYVSELVQVADRDGTKIDGVKAIEVTNGAGEGNLGDYYLKFTGLNSAEVNYAKLTTTQDTSDIMKLITEKLTASAIENGGVKYIYDASQSTLDGGKGNDYLFGNVAGGYLVGGDGVDTLRGGQNATKMAGGAGNDIFLLTGEGNTTVETDEETEETTTAYTTHQIVDYYAGKDATTKKAYGTDKIQIAYDKYSAKTDVNVPVAQAKVTAGSYSDDGKLTITVEGQKWIPQTVTGSGDSAATINGHFFADGSAAAADEKGPSYTAKYAINFKGSDETKTITVVDQGVTYTQDVSAAESVEVTANYLGKLNDNVKTIDGSKGTKAMRLVAGNATKSVVGGSKVDTLIGNGKAALEGKAGNDIFVVQKGDTVVDYSTSGANGADKVQVANLTALAEEADTLGYTKLKSVTAGTGQTFIVTFENDDYYTVTYDSGAKITKVEGADSNKYTVYNNIASALGTTVPTAGIGIDFDSISNKLSDILFEYVDPAEDKAFENGFSGENDADVAIGGVIIKGGAGKAITFQQVDTTFTEGTGKNAGKYTGTKNVTTTMTRTFSNADDATIVSDKASTYLEIFAGLDDKVEVVKGGSKGGYIVNGGTNVSSILGGAKAETIIAGNNAVKDITITSGKGNDVISWNGRQNVVVTDYTTVAVNKNSKKMTGGDVILLNLDNGKAAYSQEDLKFKGNDVIIENVANDGNTYTMTLVNGKDKVAVINNSFDAAGTLGGGFETVSTANVHEYLLAKTDTYNVENVHKEDIKTGDKVYQTNIINASLATKAQGIDARVDAASAVTEVYGGNGIDTIYAGAATEAIDGGKGNDLIYSAKASNLEITTGAGNDIIVISTDTTSLKITDYTLSQDKLYLDDGLVVKSAKIIANDDYESTVKGKNANAVTTYYSDVTLTLANANGVEFGTVTLASLAGSSQKGTGDPVYIPSNITFIKPEEGKLPNDKKAVSYALNYVDDQITVGGGKNGNDLDMTGVAATSITVAKAAKNTTVQSAKGGDVFTIENGTANGNAITYVGATVADGYQIGKAYQASLVNGTPQYTEVDATVGGAYFGDAQKAAIAQLYKKNADGTYTQYKTADFADYDVKAVSFAGGKGADKYYGNGATDTVVLGAGADSIMQGGRAFVNSDEGSNAKQQAADVFVINDRDDYTVKGFDEKDKIALYDGWELTSSAYDKTDKTLAMTYVKETTDESGAVTKTETGKITITDYEADKKVAIAGITGTTNSKTGVTTYKLGADQSAFVYGAETLTFTDKEPAAYIVTEAVNAGVKTVDASKRGAKKGLYIVDATGDVSSVIGGKGADTIEVSYSDSTLTGGAGNDVFVLNPSGKTTYTSVYTITDYGTGNDSVSIQGAAADATKLTSYASQNYSFDGSDLIVDYTGTKVIFKDVVSKGVTKDIVINGNEKVKLADPVNVTVTASADFTGDSAKRIETFTASGANKNQTFNIEASGAFRAYTGGAATANIDFSKATYTTTPSIEIKGGAGVENVTLGGGNEKFIYNGGADVLTNYAVKGTDEIDFNGWSVASIDVTDADDVAKKIDDKTELSSATVTLNLKKGNAKGTVAVTGAVSDSGISFSSDDNGYKVSISGQEYQFKEKEKKEEETGTSEMRWFLENDNNYTTSSIDEITSTSADKAAVVTDLTTDFTKTGNAFNLVSSTLTNNKKK